MDYILSRFEEESYPSTTDLPLMLLLAFLFPIIRYILDRFLFEKQGQKLLLANAKKDEGSISEADQEALHKTHIKFKESCWKSTYYTLAEAFAVAVTVGEPWATDSKMFWIGPGDQMWPDQKMKLKLKVLYAFIGGFYTYSIFAIVFWETRRKDFGVSLSHHIAAVVLIVVSYLARFGRICSVVVAIHDFSDVCLEIAKLSKYLKVELGATVFFGLFALSWLLLRMLYFPFHIIRSTSIEVVHVLAVHRDKPGCAILYYVFNTLLIMLLVMHVYWFVLILRVIKKQVAQAGRVDDVRSDDEDDD